MNLLLRGQGDAHGLRFHAVVVRSPLILLDKLIRWVLFGWRCVLPTDSQRVFDLISVIFVRKNFFRIFLFEALFSLAVGVVGINCVE